MLNRILNKKLKIMKNRITFCGIMLITLLCSNVSYAQKINQKNKYKEMRHTVQKINTPTKMWINGGWKLQSDGTRIWQKGYWKFEEKTFQEKSELLKRKINNRV